jgi:hypothetical protein
MKSALPSNDDAMAQHISKSTSMLSLAGSCGCRGEKLKFSRGSYNERSHYAPELVGLKNV